MFYRIKEAIKENRVVLIIGVCLWFVLIVFFVIPLTFEMRQKEICRQEGITFNYQLMKKIYDKSLNLTESIPYLFKENLIGDFFKNLGIFSLIFFGIAGFGLIRNMPKTKYSGKEHGSSDWCSWGEQYKVLSRSKGIILAENNYLPLDKRGNVNVLVVGGSGSGKSASYSIPNAFLLLGSYVFTDPKGELYDRTAGYLKQNGYKIKVLNLVHPQYSDGYNPLMHIASQIDVDVIANTIVKGQKSEGSSTSDPFWDDSAEMLLKALIYYLKAVRPEEEQNLVSCAELVRAANSNGGSNLLTELMSELPNDHPARTNYKSIEIAPEKTYSSILSTLQSKLGKFDSKEISELTSTDTIDFDEIGSEKTAVYVISSDTHGAYDFLLTIFFAQMIQQLYDYADNNGGKLKERTYFILDEFANIGRIPDFDKKISTSRSRGISFSVILQNLDQLEAIYDKAHETIIGNCDTHVFLGSNSQKTVEYFSKALGEKTIKHESVSISRDKERNRTGTSDSEQIMARALMTPDELRRMDNDLCIIFEKGIRPVKAKKYYYYKKPMAKILAECEISHNDIGEIDRGVWRKYNPYNPYVEEEKEEQQDNLKVESLDDLFNDEEMENNEEKGSEINETGETVNTDFAEGLKVEKKEEKMTESEYDIQKELEAKFDELFGPLDDETEGAE